MARRRLPLIRLEFLTAATIAQAVGVTKRCVIRWIERGHLPAYRFNGGPYRIAIEDWQRFLELHRVQGRLARNAA